MGPIGSLEALLIGGIISMLVISAYFARSGSRKSRR